MCYLAIHHFILLYIQYLSFTKVHIHFGLIITKPFSTGIRQREHSYGGPKWSPLDIFRYEQAFQSQPYRSQLHASFIMLKN